jgi:drug/metabolite transporter (DMT)-like permease
MLIGILCMFGVVSLWSVTPTLIKIALRSFDPFTIAFYRLTIGAAVLLVAYVVRKGKARRLIQTDSFVLIGGLGVTINYAFFCLSLNFTTAGAGGLIAQVQFIILAILAAILLKEKFRPLKIAGMGAVITGIIVVLILKGDFRSAFAAQYRLGNSFMLISGTGWAFYALSNKVLSTRRSNFEILIPMLVIGSVLTGISAIAAGGAGPPNAESLTVTPEAIGAILVLGVLSTGGGFLLVDAGMRRLSAGLAGTITGFTPVLNLIVAHFALGEPLIPMLFLCGILIALGLAGIVRSERSSLRKTDDPAT